MLVKSELTRSMVLTCICAACNLASRGPMYAKSLFKLNRDLRENRLDKLVDLIKNVRDNGDEGDEESNADEKINGENGHRSIFDIFFEPVNEGDKQIRDKHRDADDAKNIGKHHANLQQDQKNEKAEGCYRQSALQNQ